MKLNKTLLKILSFIVLVSPIAYASDCNELNEYFKDIEDVYIRNCEENSDGKIINIDIFESNITEKDINKILSYDTIISLNYLKRFDRDFSYEDQEKIKNIPRDVNYLNNLKKLKNLESLSISYDATVGIGIGADLYLAYGNIVENTLNDLISLKSLQFEGIEISQINVEEISTLTNLESLKIINSVLKSSNNYKSLNKLEKMKYLEVQPREKYNISEFVNTIKSLKELKLINADSEGGIKVDSLPNVKKISWFMSQSDVSSLGKLDKLEELDLNFEGYGDISSLEKVNQIKKLIIRKDRIYPGAASNSAAKVTIKFSEESQLKEFKFDTVKLSESNVKEILKLKNLEKLTFGGFTYFSDLSQEGAKLLKSLESRCSFEVSYSPGYSMYGIELKSFKNGPCDGSTTLPTTTITKTTVIVKPTSNNYKCGETEGKCKEGECCSSHGWCGRSDDHCLVSKGCQSEFGTCKDDIKISTNHKCGKTDGKCPNDECCSSYGWCGRSDDHCLVSKGCQSEFGTCKESVKISTNHKCGKTDGICPNDECCSSHGWCGRSDDHCLLSKGCQSEFGTCKESVKISTNHKCGKIDGICPNDECCSSHGWCGRSDDHCLVSKGCQSEFGKCK